MAEPRGPRSRAPLRGSNSRWGEASDLGGACPLLPVGESSLQRRGTSQGACSSQCGILVLLSGGAAGSPCDRVGLPGGTVATRASAAGRLPANAGI